MYNHDFKRIFKHIPILKFRKDKFLALTGVFAVSLNSMVADLLEFISQTRYELQFDWRKQYLQRYLNERFDPTSKRIVIVNSKFLPRTWHFQENENKPVYHFNQYKSTHAYVANDYCSYFEFDAVAGWVYFDVYKAKVANTGFNPRANPGKWENLTATGQLSRQWHFNNSDYHGDTRFWILLPTPIQLTPLLTYQINQAMAKFAVHGINYKIGYATEYLNDKKFL